ncbi:MAG: hypothetical protein A3H93_02970 [Rhodocyclales bacterium RIFCSPLOWO2_02_FULL_63_24]|nr:MAG: hypothetical protein A2040_15320 [Rhodocyclales bacterium GWA2_65_19]OHC69618.1 MAG: hypothetical protein A3H93_02970 [Rhodocyclales bacterium RIFCSPLOWO2_02_FULL_63_24]
MLTRRQFIKTGIAGGVLLAAAAILQKPLDRAGKQALVAGNPLDPSLRAVITAIAPVLLQDAFPVAGPERAAALERIARGVALAVGALSAAAQKEVAELFALLAFAPTRVAVAGVTASWDRASAADIEGFLRRWQHSRLDLLKSGYQALHDLVLGAWYADPQSWTAIAYPGPPVLVKS